MTYRFDEPPDTTPPPENEEPDFDDGFGQEGPPPSGALDPQPADDVRILRAQLLEARTAAYLLAHSWRTDLTPPAKWVSVALSYREDVK